MCVMSDDPLCKYAIVLVFYLIWCGIVEMMSGRTPFRIGEE